MKTSIALATLLLIAGCATLTPSRNGTTVRWLNEGSFLVRAIGGPGSTASDMGRRAMLRACKETRDRGYPYYSVVDFLTRGGVQGSQTQEEGVNLVLNSTGQAVGAVNRPAEYETSLNGNAVLTGTMFGPESLSLFVPNLQVVDANACVVYSRPD